MDPRRALVLALGAVAALTCAADPAWTKDAPLRFVLNTVEDTVDAAPGDGICADATGRRSLRAAVQEASALGTPVEIVLSRRAVYAFAIPGAGEDASATGDLDVHGSISIAGNGSRISAEFLDRVFDVHPGASLDLRNVYLGTGRVTGESGGALRCRGSVRLDRVEVHGTARAGPEGEVAGGCIFNDGGTLEVRNGRFGGSADLGGAIAARGGATTILNSRLISNQAVDGAGVHAADGTDIVVRGCFFTSCSASSRGGALYNGTGNMTVDRCRFLFNSASGDLDGDGGGGVFNAAGTLSITGSRIVAGNALGESGAGSGILNAGGRVDLVRSIVSYNFAAKGGGIATVSGHVVATRSRFVRNFAQDGPSDGAGMHITGDADVTVDRCAFVRNQAYDDGGALWSGGSARVRLLRSSFVRNEANHRAVDRGSFDPPTPVAHGGAIFHQGTHLEIERCRFDRNRASGAAGTGGAIYSVGTGLTMSLSVVSGNSAKDSGGGLDLDDGSETLLDHVSVLRNSSGGEEGAGGGIRLRGTSSLRVTGGRLIRNRAGSEGGGLWVSADGTVTLDGTRISGNRAPAGDQVFDESESSVGSD